MNKEQIIDYIEFNYPDHAEGILIVDGFDEAFLGIVESFGKNPVSCYSYEKCINIIAFPDGDRTNGDKKLKEAEEYFDYNILGAYVGDYTPVFLYSKYIV